MTRTTSNQCYQKMQGSAKRPLWTAVFKLNRQYFRTIFTVQRSPFHTATRPLRRQQLSGSSIPIRYVRHQFLWRPICDPSTPQPIQAFKNPRFKTMLDIASRVTRGISLLSPKQTRACIIHMFKQKMYLLRDRLNVCTYSCPAVAH